MTLGKNGRIQAEQEDFIMAQGEHSEVERIATYTKQGGADVVTFQPERPEVDVPEFRTPAPPDLFSAHP